MNSFKDIFQWFYLDFKNAVLSPPCSTHVLIQAPPSYFEEPLLLDHCGKPWHSTMHWWHNANTCFDSHIILALFSLSNNSANADVIANMKSKIIVSCQHFFVNVIFSVTSKVQNYQNKTGEKSLYPSKYVLTTYFKEF